MKYEDMSPAEKLELDTWRAGIAAGKAEKAAAAAAKKAARDAVLADTPANDLSLPALREAINEIKALLRGDL